MEQKRSCPPSGDEPDGVEDQWLVHLRPVDVTAWSNLASDYMLRFVELVSLYLRGESSGIYSMQEEHLEVAELFEQYTGAYDTLRDGMHSPFLPPEVARMLLYLEYANAPSIAEEGLVPLSRLIKDNMTTETFGHFGDVIRGAYVVVGDASILPRSVAKYKSNASVIEAMLSQHLPLGAMTVVGSACETLSEMGNELLRTVESGELQQEAKASAVVVIIWSMNELFEKVEYPPPSSVRWPVPELDVQFAEALVLGFEDLCNRVSAAFARPPMVIVGSLQRIRGHVHPGNHAAIEHYHGRIVAAASKTGGLVDCSGAFWRHLSAFEKKSGGCYYVHDDKGCMITTMYRCLRELQALGSMILLGAITFDAGSCPRIAKLAMDWMTDLRKRSCPVGNGKCQKAMTRFAHLAVPPVRRPPL